MKRSVLACIALAIAARSAPATAQETIHFHRNVGGDTTIGLVPGDTTTLDVLWSTFSRQLQMARVTVVYDASQLDIVGVTSGGVLPSGLLGIPGTNTFTVRGSTTSGFLFTGQNQALFKLRVILRAASPNGLYLWARVDSLQTSGGAAPHLASSGIGNVCHATFKYGDVDIDGGVDSRDALIALSAAVGLPVTGFQLANGDVDADARVNSRDALIMLSYSIGLPSPFFQTNRTGRGIPDSCPGLTPPGETVVLMGNTPAGDSLHVLAAASTVPTSIPGVPGNSAAPRLASNGTSVVYSCNDFNGPQVCRIETGGTGFQQVTSGSVYAQNADWDPAGTRVAYSSQVPYAIHHVDADGTDDTLIAAVSGFAQAYVAWNRTGTQLTYGTNSPFAVITINRDASGATPLPMSPATANIFTVTRWSPAGDSIAFTTGYGPGIWAVPAAGGTPARVAPFSAMTYLFDWGPPGIVFGVQGSGVTGLWLLPPSGLLRRLTAGSHHSPAFRRNP